MPNIVNLLKTRKRINELLNKEMIFGQQLNQNFH